MSDKSFITTDRSRYWLLFDYLLEGGIKTFLILLIYIAFGAFLVFAFVGYLPRSLGSWIIAVFVAPLFLVACEAVYKGFISISFIKRLRETIGKKTRNKSISGIRIVYLLFEFFLFLAFVWMLAQLIQAITG